MGKNSRGVASRKFFDGRLAKIFLSKRKRQTYLNNFLNQVRFDRFYRNPHTTNLSAWQLNFHTLQIWLKNTGPLFRYVRPDSTTFFRLTFAANTRTDYPFLPRNKTNPRHKSFFFSIKENRKYPIGKLFPKTFTRKPIHVRHPWVFS